MLLQNASIDSTIEDVECKTHYLDVHRDAETIRKCTLIKELVGQ